MKLPVLTPVDSIFYDRESDLFYFKLPDGTFRRLGIATVEQFSETSKHGHGLFHLKKVQLVTDQHIQDDLNILTHETTPNQSDAA